MPKHKLTVLVSWTGENYCCGLGYEGVGAVIVTAITLDELKTEFADAFKFHIESCINDGNPVPDYITTGDYEFDFQMNEYILTNYGNN